MEAKKDVVRDYVSQGLRVEDAIGIVGIAKSSYYYKSTSGRKGMQKTTTTVYKNKKVEDKKVAQCITKILSGEFIDYGYRKMTDLLKRKGYAIGKKKVYRLMKESNLLNPKPIKSKSFDKSIITEKPQPVRPLEVIEIDIKYVYIDGDAKNAYLICLFDVFHREVYVWGLFENMKTDNIVNLILNFIDYKLLRKKISIKEISLAFRTDNGSQFTSEKYRSVVDAFSIKKTYIPPATPQLNGHIESFHSTVQKLVCDKYTFTSIEYAREVFERFFVVYNNKRVLSCLLNYSPKQFMSLWNKGKIGIKKEDNNLIFFFKEEDKDKKTESF
jgi:transposase InsO family protein